VQLDRDVAQLELACNFLVGKALSDSVQNLTLPFRQVGAGRRRLLGNLGNQHIWWNVGFSAQNDFQPAKHLRDSDPLGYVTPSARGDCGMNNLWSNLSGDQHDGRRFAQGHKVRDEWNSGSARELKISKDKIEGVRVHDCGSSGFHVTDDVDVGVPASSKDRSEDVSHEGVVVHDENPQRMLGPQRSG
jgi:hypothetical protein